MRSLSVAGQMGQRVSPHWASQTAVLQGFAGFQGPDVVLREDGLAKGLAFLAAETGLDKVPAPPLTARPPPRLEAIWEPVLEDAAQDAYPRDFMGFGFGRWKG